MVYRGDYNLQEFIKTVDAWGITDVLLPFILIFTIVYAIVYKSNIFGKEKKNLSLVIALVMALTVVALHVTGTYPQNYDAVEIMNSAIPNIVLFVVGGLALLLLVGLFGESVKIRNISLFLTLAVLALYAIIFVNSIFPDISILVPIISLSGIIIYVARTKQSTEESGKVVAGAIAVLSFSCVLYYFAHAAGLIDEIPWWLQNESAIYLIIIITIMTGALSYVMGGEKEESK